MDLKEIESQIKKYEGELEGIKKEVFDINSKYGHLIRTGLRVFENGKDISGKLMLRLQELKTKKEVCQKQIEDLKKKKESESQKSQKPQSDKNQVSQEEYDSTVKLYQDRIDFQNTAANTARSFMLKYKDKFASVLKKEGLVWVFGDHKDNSGRELSFDEEKSQIEDCEKIFTFEGKERDDLIDAVLAINDGSTDSLATDEDYKNLCRNEDSIDASANPKGYDAVREIISQFGDTELVEKIRIAELEGRKSEERDLLKQYKELNEPSAELSAEAQQPGV